MAAGAAASMAQSNVYSLNVVGYVNVTVNPGFNLIANPLDDGAGNQLQNIAATTIDGANVYIYTGTGYGVQDSYVDGLGWQAATPTVIAPGTGFWFQVPPVNQGGHTTNITFVGTVLQGTTTNSLLGGHYNMISSKAPVAKQLGYIGDGTAAGTTWGFPAGDGDNAFFYSNPGGYTGGSYGYTDGLGWDDVTGLGPVTTVARGFWLQKTTSASTNWVETFTVQ